MKTSFERSNSKKNLKKLYLTWSDYGAAIRLLCQKIKLSGIKYDYVCGIPRGGLIPAVAISNMLDIPMWQFVEPHLRFKNILVVDDISDTGTSLISLTEGLHATYGNTGCSGYSKYSEEPVIIHTATIFKHTKTKLVPTYWIYENSNWVIFPYEKETE